MGVKQILCCMIIIILFHCTAPKTMGLRLKLVPWDSPNSPLYPGNLTLLEKHQRIVESSRQLIKVKTNLERISVPMKYQQNFRYSVNVKFGSPGKMVALLVDTGSGFVWTQCISTPTCYQPSRSQSYKKLPCKHPLCAKGICKCIEHQCVCKNPYGSTHNKKKLKFSMDTLHIPSSGRGPEKSFSNFVFGCSEEQALNLSGLLGLDRTPTSIVKQLTQETQGRFSYCLYIGDGYLTLGKDFNHDIGGPHVKYTQLIHTDSSTLFLNLTDISVAGKRMGLSPTMFSFKKGGVYMDTGIQYTVLPRKAYEKVSNAFASYYKGVLKKLDKTYWNLDRCYKLTPGFKDFPSMTFHFQGRADLVTRYTYVYNEEVACLAVVRGRRTIIGAVQQWNIRFMFDVNKNVLKFHKDDCASHAH